MITKDVPELLVALGDLLLGRSSLTLATTLKPHWVEVAFLGFRV